MHSVVFAGFSSDALDFMVDLAYNNALGARGLRGICETILKRYMFEIPSESKKKKSLEITREMAEAEWNHLDSLKYQDN